MKVFALLCLLISLINASKLNLNDAKIDEKHKMQLIEWIKNDFTSSLINSSSDPNLELKQLQTYVLKSRNAECLFNKYGDLEKYAEELDQLSQNEFNFNQFVNAWKNTSSFNSIDLNTVEKFNQMV